MQDKVCLVKCKGFDRESIKKAVYESIDLLEYKPNDTPEKIAIKPNLCYYWDYTVGETTDPRLISALIDYIRDDWNDEAKIDIVETDASAMKIKHAYKMLWYEKLAEEKSVRLVNLSEGDVIEKIVKVGNFEVNIPISPSLFEYDMLINVPKLKIGPYASGQAPEITCALKNLYGLIAEPRKVKFHPKLNEYIVAINKIVRPQLTVVDGIIGLGKYPVKLGLIISGTNVLSVDIIASKIMGFNPKKIKHLSLAEKEGLGTFQNVKVIGEQIEDFQKVFPRRSQLLFKMSWKLQLFLLYLYARITGDVIPPVVERS